MNEEIIIPINQNNKEASYYPQISEKDILIDFSKTSVEINALIRALTPWQPAYIAHKRSFFKVKRIKFFENKTRIKSHSTILKRKGNTIWVTTSDNKIAKITGLKLFGKFAQFLTPFYMHFCVKAGDLCR